MYTDLPVKMYWALQVWSRSVKTLIRNYHDLVQQQELTLVQEAGAKRMIEEFIDSEITDEMVTYCENNTKRGAMVYGSEFHDMTSKCEEAINEGLSNEFKDDIAFWTDVYEQYINMKTFLTDKIA